MHLLPQTRPARIALGAMLGACAGFLSTGWIGHGEGIGALLLGILHHGFEGAVVGGVCDIIAVKKVYEKAQERFDGLVQGASLLVVREMIGVKGLVQNSSNLEDWLKVPENQAWLRDSLQEWLPSRDELFLRLADFWESGLQVQAVSWLLEVDLKQLLLGRSVDTGLMQSPVIRQALAGGLRQIADDDELAASFVQRMQGMSGAISLADLGLPAQPEELQHLAQQLWQGWGAEGEQKGLRNTLAQQVIRFLVPAVASHVETTTLKDVLSPALDPPRVQLALHRFSERIEEDGDSTEIHPELLDAILEYLGAYFDAWNAMPFGEREAVAQEVLEAWKPILFEVSVDFVWALREQLLRPESLLENPWLAELLGQLSSEGGEHAGRLEDQAVELLVAKLTGMGSAGFVEVLRQRTQEPLDWIKVNGVLWGFAIGCAAGSVSAGIGWLRAGGL
jgi:hypothetical protein